MISVRGSVPYPSGVDARPMYELSQNMRSLGQSVTEAAAEIRTSTRINHGTWSGSAADRFTERMTERSTVVGAVAEVAMEAAPLIDLFAMAIDQSQYAYSVAAQTEVTLRPYLPHTLNAVQAALSGQAASIAALYAAGLSFAGSLSALMLKAEAADTFGITRNPFEVMRDTWQNITDAWNDDDMLTGLTRGANQTGRIEHADGSVTQFNILGLSIEFSGLGPIAGALETVGGMIGLLSSEPLTIREANAELGTLQDAGFVSQPTTAREVGHNLALTEEFQRRAGIEPDQSSVIPFSIGVDPSGQRVVTVHIPGIVPPGEGSINGNTGERNVIGAAISQTTGLGSMETSVRQLLANVNLQRGDRAVLYGHSYGGIGARNIANALAREGIEVTFVSLGSPDGPLERGVGAFMVQNVNDPVPATRIGGAGRSGGRYENNQHVITLHQRAEGGLIDNHASRFYGENLTRTPNLDFSDFLRRQRLVRQTSEGMVIIEGPRTPSGAPNTGREPYRLPPPPSPAGR
jgi:hypothetical protein